MNTGNRERSPAEVHQRSLREFDNHKWFSLKRGESERGSILPMGRCQTVLVTVTSDGKEAGPHPIAQGNFNCTRITTQHYVDTQNDAWCESRHHLAAVWVGWNRTHKDRETNHIGPVSYPR